MRRLMCILLIAMLLIPFCPAQADAGKAASTTLLVYMCGSNLQDSAVIDLYEMAEAETGEDMNIVVMAGGAQSWDDEDLTGGTRNLVTIQGGYFTDVQDWGAGSMGDPQCLVEFLEYGLTEYPADRTIVVLWNHGMGSEGGMCVDKTANEDALTLNEINEALYQVDDDVPGYHIDVLGCDACMMATYEMAALLCHYNIDYFVASEEVEPGLGWYYTPWLKALDSDPGMSNEALCGMIVDSFMEDCYKYGPESDLFQLSAVRLSDIYALTELVEGFAANMTTSINGGQLATVRRGRSRVYTFGSFCDGSWDMVDLGAALDAWAEFDPDAVGEAKKLLEKAVVANQKTDTLDTCCGLSILVPNDACEAYYEYRDGYDLSYYLPNWVEFLDTYVGMITGSNYNFITQTATQLSSGDTVTGTGCSLWDIDWSSLLGGEESHVITEGEYGFTMQLTDDEMDNLDYVEGMLMMDVSDDEMDCYVDLGLLRNNAVDWNTGEVYSLFDGSWPLFGEQLVAMYDQAWTGHSRRSLIPVKLNGEYTYLVVVFPEGSTEGRIIGANAGYDDNGLPIRETTKLTEGDRIVPMYTMYYVDAEADEDADLEETEYEGDEIVWEDGMTVNFVSMSEEEKDGEEPIQVLFCFVLNDIFGDSDMSDPISFEL